ncbi:hypothetical protein GUJ93_ZPchr0011g27150 [Zizania palustris]|uniref:Chlorophyll a-b binding protein, chloroplastic n=1 Tax=Zizania palustris TaxID=103762 RepID=A0A8J6BU85_ZIZPA|nr:hypothetical protein GUJ93_ZPchr0011g27150 [Zizania palustris]
MGCPIKCKQQIALLGTQPMAAAMARSWLGPHHPPILISIHLSGHHTMTRAQPATHSSTPLPLLAGAAPLPPLNRRGVRPTTHGMAALAPSKMVGTCLNFAGSSRSGSATAARRTTRAHNKIVSLFSKFKKAAPAPKPKPAAVTSSSPDIGDELAKWYGPDRKIFLPSGLLDRSEVPEYLNGEVPGDYGYDPFGLSKKPEDFSKYQAYELIHARWAMLGAAGFIIPEAFNKFGANCGPEAVWFKTGALLLDGNTLNYFGNSIPINLVVAVVAEVVLVGGAEYYRIINGLDLDDKLHPGGPFDPLGLASDPDQAALLKVKEIKNGRLAMFSMLGFFIQAYVTGEGPVENLSKHLSDPFGNNLLTVISGAAERVPSL